MEAMTTADHPTDGPRGAVLRWTHAAVIALTAVLAVLVHHETAAAVTHVPPAGAMAGMHHTSTTTVSVHAGGHAMPPGVTTPASAHDDGGACSGTAMQHCSAAVADGMKLVPPHQPSVDCAPALCAGAAVSRDIPGTTGRAPPDLSFLSRLLL
ncbi:hypothetical protein BKI49_00425 [Streptomyces sp. Tue6028]|uniref:hypothetical protein n=1 Tax=Streptomyces sp. Tue6028 TaxID=2036037 RepID=UPI000BB3AA72|nr:hypothetical protein [Streptomyces sp. Tue6028]PBC65767.1 hypothetical protein BKI49_00425 [Streptomyces sp. Tue6028]